MSVKVGQVFTMKAAIIAEHERLRKHCAQNGTEALVHDLPKFGNVTITSVEGGRITANAEDGRALECTVLGLLQDYEEVIA